MYSRIECSFVQKKNKNSHSYLFLNLTSSTTSINLLINLLINKFNYKIEFILQLIIIIINNFVLPSSNILNNITYIEWAVI